MLSDLLNHFRNLLIYQVSRGDLKMLEVSEAEAASLAEQSAGANTEALTRIMEVLSDAEMRLRDAASKKILIEVTLLKAIEARQAMSLDSVLQKLQSLRNGGGTGNSPAPSAPATPATTPRPAQPSAPVAKPRVAEPSHSQAVESPISAAVVRESAPAPGGNGFDLQDLWSRLVEAVGRASPFARTYLLEAHPVLLAKNLLTIGFDPEFEDHISLVDNARNHTLLQTKLGELGHAGVQIKFIKSERPGDWTAQPVAAVAPEAAAAPTATKPTTAGAAQPKEKSGSFSKDDFKNDPLIQKALEIFKGQIVEVRT